MLRIYHVAIQIVREVKVHADRIAMHDAEHAKQTRKASLSIVLNIAEGSATRDGKRRNRYSDALGSARETFSALEVAEALGYTEPMTAQLRNRFDHVIGTLVNLLR
jgi:four helix bundle protein